MPPLVTVRIPNLPPKTPDLALSMNDRMPLWISGEDLTKYVKLQDLYTFFSIGSGGSDHPPVFWGGQLLYKVPSGVSPGTTTVNLPAYAGFDFTLQRGNQPLEALKPDLSNVATAEFDVLDAGGWKLLQSGNELIPNERYVLTFFSLIGGPGSGGGGSTSSSFIQGKKSVATNYSIDPAADMNKVIQFRSDTDQVTVTLPSVADAPANSFLVFESNINTSVENKIQTSGGQNIYFGGTSKTAIYIRPGETLWLYRDEDGWYLISDFYKNYDQLAQPFAVYKIGLNQILCKGQLLLRADYPRLWEFIQTLGSSLVSDATWLLASGTLSGRTILKPYRGCFSTGDGSTTFRMPDLMNMFIRGLLSDSGSDTERYINQSGIYQDSQFESHGHGINTSNGSPSGNAGADPVRATIAGTANTRGSKATPPTDDKTIALTGGAETRPGNIGMLWVINC